MFEDKIPRSRK